MDEAQARRDRTRWLVADRFGLFLHWGIYSAAARHEWVKNYEKITDADYQKYFDHFDPDLFDPARWAEDAWRAGMRYFVITTKHHDGFCLWDSALTDYKVTNTPYGRDLLGPLVTAFRNRGFKVGFYHSLLDWHHPEFPIDSLHPQRDRGDAGDRDIRRYAEYLHGQVRELLTNFGRIDIIWFDFSYPDRGPDGKGRDDWQSERLLAMVRELQPHIIVNNRLDLGSGDVVTPEQFQPAADLGGDVPWEACQTLNGSWGYHRDNLDWKPADLLIRMLVDGVSKGGNLLLNVGPNARGEFEPRAVERLHTIGDWMRRHERSIRDAGPSTFTPPADCRYTQVGNRLYLHLFAWPMRHVHLPDLAGKVEYAQLLNDASEIAIVATGGREHDNTRLTGVPADALTLELPVQRPDVAVPVVELFLKD